MLLDELQGKGVGNTDKSRVVVQKVFSLLLSVCQFEAREVGFVWCMMWCMYDVWCMMYDVWCMMYDVWCMMCGVWCMMCDVWCVMCDVRISFILLPYLIQAITHGGKGSSLQGALGILRNLQKHLLSRAGAWCVWCVMCDVCDVWCVMCDVWCVCVWFVMCDVWCMMCNVWCMMYDIWYMMYDVWCVMYDVCRWMDPSRPKEEDRSSEARWIRRDMENTFTDIKWFCSACCSWYDVWCMWCMIYDVWCMMYDVWCMMCDVWCMMYDVWCRCFLYT